ncbi:eIF-4E [Symbiodinium necroappetens]|uniref:eIF-4E protein n=1 Tax=Symbiodinium necroappetens TaxID=1628268 RepID=A0A813BG02_9DINO|nr:eIF-4E [Symbiodinium necroappetens]
MAAYAYFQGHAQPMDGRLGNHIRVSQADMQGLGLNLAYFIARNGLADLQNSCVPRVFDHGHPVDLLEAARKHVTMGYLAQATDYMSTVDIDRAWQKVRLNTQRAARAAQAPERKRRPLGASTRVLRDVGTDPGDGSSSGREEQDGFFEHFP